MKDNRQWNNICWLVLGCAGLLIFLKFYSHVFPVASIDLVLSKAQVTKRAQDFLDSQSIAHQDYDRAMLFSSDSSASIYLQKTVGIKKSNELIKSKIPVWYWRLRWYKELQKEGYVIDVDPASGEIIYFQHAMLETAEGENASIAQAQEVAQDLLKSKGIELKNYELKDSTSQQLKNRIDCAFSWEERDFKVGDAVMRIDIGVCGGKLCSYSKYLKVPEDFSRRLKKELSLGNLLGKTSHILMFVLLVGSLVFMVARYRNLMIRWKLGLSFTAIVSFLSLMYFFNSLPLIWMFYPDTVSKAMFFMMSLGNAFSGILAQALTVFAFVTLGEIYCRGKESKFPLIDSLKANKINGPQIFKVSLIGYSLGFAFLGYITIFYFIGTRFFNIWMPPNTYYSNILGTVFPFLFPLTIAVTASVNEEFTYRMLAVSFLQKLTSKNILAIFVPALLWGFAHSHYMIFPVYARGIELTIYGIILGVVFLRFGIETVLIAHFVINAFLAGLPLLKSSNPYYFASGILVVLIVFIPIPLIMLLRKYSLFFKGKICRYHP